MNHQTTSAKHLNGKEEPIQMATPPIPVINDKHHPAIEINNPSAFQIVHLSTQKIEKSTDCGIYGFGADSNMKVTQKGNEGNQDTDLILRIQD